MRRKLQDLSEWHGWFAWHPVCVEGHFVWLERIERKITDLLFVDRTEYRFAASLADAQNPEVTALSPQENICESE